MNNTSTHLPSVAVLGLGHIGTAMARRLHGRGHLVTTWSRSGRRLDGMTSAQDAAAAVSASDVVVLCLFDAAACDAVIDAARHELIAGRSVINTTTTGPDEATKLALMVASTGATYLHSPVLGSVAAVLAGELTVLLGADTEPSLASTAVLEGLGDVMPCGSPADAAAAKLLANGVLGDALVSLREAQVRGTELGIDTERVLTVLERTLLRPLVRGKRKMLEALDFSDTQFAVAALAKDLALLTASAPSAAPLRDDIAASVATGAAEPGDDVAALCVPPTGKERPHHLVLGPGVIASPEVMTPLEAYVAGHATGDPSHHRRAFLPTAHIEGCRDGDFISWPLDEYCTLFSGRPAEDEHQRCRSLDRLEVHGPVATATMTLHHGDAVFTDVFLLVRRGDEWRISNKVFDRQPRSA